MGIRISKDHLHPSVIESITSLIGDLNQLETTAKGNAVEAINELLANGGNKEELEALIAEITEGKELIANAVGEPLTAEESFDEMSNDINSLLSTFKANMMKNGITVEGSDRFKSLIDKIATMVEEGSGKGIQFVEGTVVCADSMDFKNNLGDSDIYLEYVDLTDVLSFEPMFIILTHISATNAGGLSIYTNPSTGFYFKNIPYTKNKHLAHIAFYDGLGDTYVITSGRLTIPVASTGSWTYYAIGVGEEDTTLRDSLADILENKGVDVTEEDDMASLISKVDNMSVFQYGDTEGYDYNIAFVNKETVTGNTYTTVLEKIIPSGISVVRLELFLQAGSSSSVKAYCTVKHLRGETVLYENEYSSNSYGSYQEKGNTFEVIEGDVVQVQLKAGDAYSRAIISNVSLSVSAK